MLDASKRFEAIYADDSLLVLNKSAGLLAVPGRGADKQDCLSSRVQQQYLDALVVHRLDMATSGLMLMARGKAIQGALSKLFAQREIGKRYVAVVDGSMAALNTQLNDNGWGLIDLPMAPDWPRRPLQAVNEAIGKPSQTRWRIVTFDKAGKSTRVELEPVTGRTHQLRVHLQALGHPILGDALYAPAAVQARAPRLLLHACALTFKHPASGAHMVFESAPDF